MDDEADCGGTLDEKVGNHSWMSAGYIFATAAALSPPLCCTEPVAGPRRPSLLSVHTHTQCRHSSHLCINELLSFQVCSAEGKHAGEMAFLCLRFLNWHLEQPRCTEWRYGLTALTC